MVFSIWYKALLLRLSRIMVVLKITVYSSEIFEEVKDVIE